MILIVSSVVCVVLGLAFLWFGIRLLRRGKYLLSPVMGSIGVTWLLAALSVWLLGTSLVTYQRLTVERPVLILTLQQLGPRYFAATVTFPDAASQRLELRGDEWQVDARLLKLRAPVNIAGFDSVYRLERLSGRYTKIDDERAAVRTVHALPPATTVDAWELARRYQDWLPWVDALYGSAAYLPMADGAQYEVKVTQTGLVARALNQPAQRAVGTWR